MPQLGAQHFSRLACQPLHRLSCLSCLSRQTAHQSAAGADALPAVAGAELKLAPQLFNPHVGAKIVVSLRPGVFHNCAQHLHGAS